MAKPQDEDFDFGDWIKEFGHGAANRQAGALMQRLVKACQEVARTGAARKGKMNIAIEVSAGAGPGALAELRISIKTTEPQPNLPGDHYYIAEDGSLVTEDPRQQDLPLPKSIPLTSIKNPKEPS